MHTLACKYTHYLTLVTLCVQGLLCTPQLFINNTHKHTTQTHHTSLSWGLPNMNQDLWLARPIANQGKNPERTLSFLEKTLGKPITMNTAQSYHIARLYTVQFSLRHFSGQVAMFSCPYCSPASHPGLHLKTLIDLIEKKIIIYINK